MFNFSERFMEDCVIEAPEAFLGKNYTVLHQQPRIGGFIPDLIVQSEAGVTIVEIQKNALDRFHLYKTLEYRDLFAEHKNVLPPAVLLVCNELEEKYRKICATHSVGIISIPRKDWIEIALKTCPETIAAQLMEQAARSENSPGNAPKEAFSHQFSPLLFDDYTDVHAYWTHLNHELERLGFENKDHRYRGLIRDLESFLDSGLQEALEAVSPTNWNIDKLLAEPEKWIPPELKAIKRIRKPKIVLTTYVTKKGNLSTCWRPAGEYYSNLGLPKYDLGDWASWCGDEIYGWQRPPNELLFLHDFEHLGPQRNVGPYDTLNWYVVEELILTITHKIHELITDHLSPIVDVTKITEFGVKTEEAGPGENRFRDNLRVVGWDIFDVEKRSLDRERQKLEEFLSKNSLDISKLSDLYVGALKKRNRRSLGSGIEYFRRDLKEKGIFLGRQELELLVASAKKFYPTLWTPEF